MSYNLRPRTGQRGKRSRSRGHELQASSYKEWSISRRASGGDLHVPQTTRTIQPIPPLLLHALRVSGLRRKRLRAGSWCLHTGTPHRYELEKTAILSLGCGSRHPSDVKRDPGILWWLSSGKLVDSLKNGTCEYIQGVIDYWLYSNLDLELGQYMRIQKAAMDPATEKLFARLDDVDALPKLEKIGEQLAHHYERALKVFVKEFIFAKQTEK